MDSYVVIGGGLAGLTAANALAGNGNKVTLLEQSQHFGGRAQTQQQHGYFMNLGPHALYCGGVAMQTFREWNIPFSGNFPPQSGRNYLVRENKLYPAVHDVRSLMTTRLFSVREKFEAVRLFSLFTGGRSSEGETMRQWVDRHARSERVREFAATITRIATYTTDLEHLSAKAALEQLSLAIKHNVWYLDGGWQTLIDGLLNRAISLGVEICHEHVVTMDALKADGIVLAVGPASVEKLTGIPVPRQRPLRMASLNIGLRKLSTEAAHVAFGLDRPLYFSVHSESVRLAPEGKALAHVAKYLGDSQPDPNAVREELEDYASLVMPQWQREAEVVRFLPNLTVTPMMAVPEGRPDVDFLGLENITVAGDWVGTEGMLADAAVASALKAVSVIQQRKLQVA
ncbi:MAG TPA: FAD-dependent oxidoreductase [Pseudacidobacterium sp.]|nr:FAD-dependent oxidoreductase [Pseudacidobacterium sp.]